MKIWKAGSQDKDKLLTEFDAIPGEDIDRYSDPIFKVKKVRMGKGASRSVEKGLYSQ